MAREGVGACAASTSDVAGQGFTDSRPLKGEEEGVEA